MASDKREIYNNLQEQYEHMGVSTELIKDFEDFTIFNLKDLGREMPFGLPTSRLNFFVFGFIKDAHGKYAVDDKEFLLRPNTVYFTNPGHYRSYEYQCLEEAYIVTMSESFLKQNVNKDIYDKFPFLLTETFPPVVVSDQAFEEFERLFKLIHLEYKSRSPYRVKIVATLFVVLLHKYREHCFMDYIAAHDGDRGGEIVKKFKIMLEQHYRDLANGSVKVLFRTQDYADLMKLHPNHLSTVIKNKTGKPIGEWIAEKTITQARALLQNTGDNIKIIAAKLGFSNSANFSNYFKKNTGQSPAVYRVEAKEKLRTQLGAEMLQNK